MLSPDSILSFIIFLPALFALGLLAFDGQAKEGMRYFTLLGTAITFALTIQLYMGYDLDPSAATMQMKCNLEWIKHWNVYYSLGVDGISLPLVMLTGLVFVLSALASWSVDKHVKGYLMLFLILETGVLGVFL